MEGETERKKKEKRVGIKYFNQSTVFSALV